MEPSPITTARAATPILNVTFDFKKEEDKEYNLSGQDETARIKRQLETLTIQLNQESAKAQRKIIR
jgi:hypothetical protein